MNEDLFADIDGATIIDMLRAKIQQVKRLLADTALDVEALRNNPDVTREERDAVDRVYRARRFQLAFFQKRLDESEEALRGGR